VTEETWAAADAARRKSSVRVTGTVREEGRAPGGVELGVETFEILGLRGEYPITPKEHGTDFLMDHRHLWLRSKQHAVLRIRNEVEKGDPRLFLRSRFRPHRLADPHRECGRGDVDAVRDRLLRREGVPLAVGPALPRAGRRGVRRVYCFGPTFRAEKSKTRRHLMEFWMVEPEVAFLEFEGLQRWPRSSSSTSSRRALERCQEELKTLERDQSKLENVKRPFPRITYREAIELLQERDAEAKFGDDIGGDEETVIANSFDRPVMITAIRRRSKRSTCSPIRTIRRSPSAWT
jgi:asparaginyl-tRNA synthetase